MKAIKITRAKMVCTVATDRMKMALAKNIPAATDAELVEGAEVFFVSKEAKW